MTPSSIMIDPLGHSATYVYNNDDQLTSTTDRNGRRRPRRGEAETGTFLNAIVFCAR